MPGTLRPPFARKVGVVPGTLLARARLVGTLLATTHAPCQHARATLACAHLIHRSRVHSHPRALLQHYDPTRTVPMSSQPRQFGVKLSLALCKSIQGAPHRGDASSRSANAVRHATPARAACNAMQGFPRLVRAAATGYDLLRCGIALALVQGIGHAMADRVRTAKSPTGHARPPWDGSADPARQERTNKRRTNRPQRHAHVECLSRPVIANASRALNAPDKARQGDALRAHPQRTVLRRAATRGCCGRAMIRPGGRGA